jgi:hypothetical protein
MTDNAIVDITSLDLPDLARHFNDQRLLDPPHSKGTKKNIEGILKKWSR